MKKILYILLFVPLIGFGQEQDACYSINEVFSQMDVENPSITKNFVVGWNMFGYPCSQPIDLAEAFSSIVDKIVIVKDNSGAVYMDVQAQTIVTTIQRLIPMMVLVFIQSNSMIVMGIAYKY